MSVNMLLDDNYDINITNGSIARVYDSSQILQLVESRVLLVQQEWFLDLSAGLPWFTEMTGKHASIYTIRSYISNEIVNTPGVESLQAIDLEYDTDRRKLQILFKYTDIFGKQTSGSF